LAVSTCVWPLFEIENGKVSLNYIPKEKKPVDAFLKPQGRFAHLFQTENDWMLKRFQNQVDSQWDDLANAHGQKREND